MNFRFVSAFLVLPLAFLVTISTAQSPSGESKKILVAEIIRKYELDTLSTLMSRVKDLPKELEEILGQYGKFHPINHLPDKKQREQLERAFTRLPAIYLKILKAHVRSISFVDSISLRAMTYTVNRANYSIYDIVINAATFNQDVSTWLTNKERTCFEPGDSPLSVSISAGKNDALVYVLIHEATHVIDYVLGLTDANSDYFKANSGIASAFKRGVWLNDRTPVSMFRNSILDSTRFSGGKTLPFETAPRIYAAFQQTPFVSLYSMFSLSEDIADLFTLYYLTQHLSQPYVIQIKKKGRVTFSYEPAKSSTIKERFKYAALVIGSN